MELRTGDAAAPAGPMPRPTKLSTRVARALVGAPRQLRHCNRGPAAPFKMAGLALLILRGLPADEMPCRDGRRDHRSGRPAGLRPTQTLAPEGQVRAGRRPHAANDAGGE